MIHGVTVTEIREGHARLAVDTGTVGISEVIAALSARLNLTDLSVEGVSAEELVVGLYREFAI